jgi:hypothetical protein
MTSRSLYPSTIISCFCILSDDQQDFNWYKEIKKQGKMKTARIIKTEIVPPSNQIQVHVKCPICKDKHIHGCGTQKRPQEIEGAVKLSHCLYKQCESYVLHQDEK